MNPVSAVMQVYRDKDGLCWYISDKPFESHALKPFTIYNKGNGYFEYYGPNAPLGSDYYIENLRSGEMDEIKFNHILYYLLTV